MAPSLMNSEISCMVVVPGFSFITCTTKRIAVTKAIKLAIIARTEMFIFYLLNLKRYEEYFILYPWRKSMLSDIFWS